MKCSRSKSRGDDLQVTENGNKGEGIAMISYRNNTLPLEAQYLYRRGREMMDQKKEDIALVYLRQAVFIAPGFSKAYQELGKCLACLGRPEEAAACYGKVTRNNPHSNAAIAGMVTD
jgi:tetratricopeptide (TPR) repeat protein